MLYIYIYQHYIYVDAMATISREIKMRNLMTCGEIVDLGLHLLQAAGGSKDLYYIAHGPKGHHKALETGSTRC